MAFMVYVPQMAADSGMQDALRCSSQSGLGRVAQLLSGHQTAAAAVLAASMGDVRLATLLAQVCIVWVLSPSTLHHAGHCAFCGKQPSNSIISDQIEEV